MSRFDFKPLSYMIYPRRCEICYDVVPMDEVICERCKDVKRIKGKICTKCGKIKADCICDKARHKPDYNAIVAPFYYDETIVSIVHSFKFFKQSDLAIPMSKQMLSVINERYNGISFDYITSVPLHYTRNIVRGYNQSALLAKALSKQMDVPYKKTLHKLFRNKPQRTMSAKRRRGNVFGVYDLIDGVDVEDKTILIVDDVKTTGSTINECASILKAYGASAVYAVVYAIR